MYGANPCVSKLDYSTLRNGVKQKEPMDGNQNGQCSLKYQERGARSSNVAAIMTDMHHILHIVFVSIPEDAQSIDCYINSMMIITMLMFNLYHNNEL